jgi:hypothetical protein
LLKSILVIKREINTWGVTSTLEIKGSHDMISPIDPRSTTTIFDHDGVFEI